MNARKTRSIATSLRLLAACALLAVTVVASPLAAADDITGEWEVTMDFGGRDTLATLTITRGSDGKLAGKWGSSEVSNVKFEDGKLTFVRTVRFGDQEFSLEYEGRLKDGAITGTLSSDQGEFAANAKRRKPKSPALGRWNIAYSIGDRDIESTLAVSESSEGKLSVAWESSGGEHEVSNVAFEKGKLSFARKSKFGDREFESTYEGTIDGDKLTGMIKSQRGEIEANGTRVGAGVIGTWELRSEGGQGGPRTNMLRVFGDLTGRYETFGGETPVKEIKVDGNSVAFSIEMSFGDQAFTIDFKATRDGKTLKGEVTTPRGSRSVTGKMVEAAPAVPSVVGTWVFTRETDGGTRTTTVTIKDDLTGTYARGENSTAIQDVSYEGGVLAFKVIRTFGDREVEMTFKGKVEGGQLKGTFTTPRGEREAVGKRVDAAESL